MIYGSRKRGSFQLHNSARTPYTKIGIQKRIFRVNSNHSNLNLLDTDVSRILLAEDNIVNRKIIEKMIEKGGYEVDYVENGVDALSAVQNGDYLCVLMDIHMPEMDGIEATRHIRSLQSWKSTTPIIAVTANVVEDVRQEALDAGMDEFLCKPVKYGELLDAIKRHIIN